MNFKRLLQLFKEQLSDIYDEQEIAAIFHTVAGHISGLSRSQLVFNSLDVLPELAVGRYLKVLQGLQERQPLQYLLGEAHFYGLNFKVTPAVLIPRPETEELVDWIIERYKGATGGRKVMDIGTGSGCIAIVLKKHLVNAAVYALDISEEAIQIAEDNATLNEVIISFIHSDIFRYVTMEKFDVIVSNPPYITENEKEEMHENVLAHEPHLALFVSNEKPLIFYETIADFALSNLHPDGQLFFEINANSGREMVDMLELKGFTDIELRKDMQGNDRMIRCTVK